MAEEIREHCEISESDSRAIRRRLLKLRTYVWARKAQQRAAHFDRKPGRLTQRNFYNYIGRERTVASMASVNGVAAQIPRSEELWFSPLWLILDGQRPSPDILTKRVETLSQEGPVTRQSFESFELEVLQWQLYAADRQQDAGEPAANSPWTAADLEAVLELKADAEFVADRLAGLWSEWLKSIAADRDRAAHAKHSDVQVHQQRMLAEPVQWSFVLLAAAMLLCLAVASDALSDVASTTMCGIALACTFSARCRSFPLLVSA